jgi:Ca-activated chloride channel family protein
MSFLWPVLLGLLTLLPLLGLVYVFMQRKRRSAAASASGLGLARTSNATDPRRPIPALIFFLGLAVLFFSLARPQATVVLPKYDGTLILVFDVSGSMAAEDIEPNRMEAAKKIASEFVRDQPAEVRVGVVAFSDGGLTVQAPGVNRENTLTTIERLVPRRSTSLGNGVLVALNTIAVDAGDPPIVDTTNLSTADDSPAVPQGWYPSAVIVLFSDGESNTPPDPLVVTDLAADLGVRIYTIGVGSTQGVTIQVEGMTVHTALNEPLLAEIARVTGGRYYFAGDQTVLRAIYNDLEPTLSIRAEALEITSLLAGLAILIFLIGGALSMFWFGRVI